jgi:hypothetical protein
MVSRGKREESTPGKMPASDPSSYYPASDYSFTLQAVMEMQKTVGQLTQAVQTLQEQQKSFSQKLDRISHQIYAALAILLLIGGLLTFFAKSINDVITHAILSSGQQQTQPIQQVTPIPRKIQ